MAVLAPPSQEQELEWPQPLRWTIEEYERAFELGAFGTNLRLELIDGEILRKMSPQNSPHATGIELTANQLRSILGKGFSVRTQLPFNIGRRSQPEPDVYVVS